MIISKIVLTFWGLFFNCSSIVIEGSGPFCLFLRTEKTETQQKQDALHYCEGFSFIYDCFCAVLKDFIHSRFCASVKAFYFICSCFCAALNRNEWY